MSFINWGGESPEQRAIRARIEQEALYEQAVRMAQARNAQQMGGAAGGSNANVPKVAGTTVFVSTGAATGNFEFNSFNFDSGSFGKTYDSGVDASFYYYDANYVVQDKGYMFVFRGNGDNNDYALVFTGPQGNLLSVDTGSTGDLTTNYSQGKWLYAYDYDERILWYSDGVTVTRNETLLAGSYDFSVGTAGVDSNPNGLAVYTINQVGSPVQNQWDFYLIPTPKSEPVLIFSDLVDTEISFTYAQLAGSSKIIKEEYNNDTHEYLSLTIYESDGTVSNTIDLTTSPGGYFNRERYTYGTSKYLWIFESNHDYLVVQYDSINGYLYTVNHDSVDYPDWHVTCGDNYYPGDFNDFDYSENAMVSFYNETAYDYGLVTVDGCDFLLFFGNSAPVLHTYDTISSPESKGVNFNRSTVTPDAIVFPCDEGTGNISIRSFGPTSSSQNDFGSPGYSSNDYQVDDYWLVGSRVLYVIQSKSFPGDSNFILIDSDGATQLGETLTISTNEYSVRRDYDTVYIQIYANDMSDGWYFKNDSTEWTRIGYFYDDAEPSSYYQLGSNTAPGNIALTQDAERIYWFNDVADYDTSGMVPILLRDNVISDGGNDMYDGGNILNTNLGSEIAYTHTQMNINDINEGNEAALADFIMDGEVKVGSNIDFGVGSSYFTNLYPGLFVLSVNNPEIESFSVTGSLGSDGTNIDGDYDKVTTTHNGKTYTYYWKREWRSESDLPSEPSVNHLIIIDSDGTDIQHTASEYNDDTDDHSIESTVLGNMDITKLHYLVFSKFRRIKVSDQELASLVNSYLNLVDPIGSSPTFAQTLTSLNTNYATITANLPSHDQTINVRTLTPTSDSSFNLPNYERLRIGKNRMLVAYEDTERDGLISIRLYDFNGAVINTVETTQPYSWDIVCIGDKLFAINTTKVYDSTLDITCIDYYVYVITDTGVKSKMIRVPDSDNDFNWELNDFVYWY